MTRHGPVTMGPAPEDLTIGHASLLVLDVDEVALHFITPFAALLEEFGARLHPESFRLTGNVRSVSTGAVLSGHELDRMTLRLYEEQETRQRPVEGIAAALERLSAGADILFLTAMTPSFYPQRRRLLDASDLPYPMIATERSKGAVVAELAERWQGPIVFVDDLPPNLASVRKSVPAARLLHFMANDVFRPHLPALPPDVASAVRWSDAEGILLRLLASGRAA